MSQGVSEQLVVVHTGLQVAEKQIRQLEATGARGALADFQTLNAVKAATDQTVQAVAELRVTAGQAKRVAEQAVECAENSQRGMISYESRLGVVKGAIEAHPRAPDHASFGAHLETIQKDVHAALAPAIRCSENAAKAEAESEEHVSFAQGQRQVMEQLVARCQGLHSELMATPGRQHRHHRRGRHRIQQHRHRIQQCRHCIQQGRHCIQQRRHRANTWGTTLHQSIRLGLQKGVVMTMRVEAIPILREANDTVIPSGDRLLLLPFHRPISLWRTAWTTPIWTSGDS